MKFKDGNIAIRPYGPKVMGQWKRLGNVSAIAGKQTVFVVPHISELPPGKDISVLYTNRALYHANRLKVDQTRVALIATDALLSECEKWIAIQPQIFETIELEEYVNPLAGATRSLDSYNYKPRGMYEIDNDTLYEQVKAGATLAELAQKYGCGYHNLYNRYHRHVKNLNKKNNSILKGNTYYDIDNKELVYQIETLGMSLHECAEEYGCTYQVIYARYKRYGTKNKKVVDN